jgi:hypothetical protein
MTDGDLPKECWRVVAQSVDSDELDPLILAPQFESLSRTCWKNISPAPMRVLLQHPGLKQSVHETISSLRRFIFVFVTRFGCRSARISFWNFDSAIISIHSWRTLLSDTGSWRSFAKLTNASSFLPLDASQRGENGRKSIPAPKIRPGTVWIKKGNCHDQWDSRYWVPYVIQKEIMMPKTMLNSSKTRRDPRISGGDISEM